MAAIAAIFQWPLSELAAMELTDLIRWRELAVERWNRMQGQE